MSQADFEDVTQQLMAAQKRLVRFSSFLRLHDPGVCGDYGEAHEETCEAQVGNKHLRSNGRATQPAKEGTCLPDEQRAKLRRVDVEMQLVELDLGNSQYGLAYSSPVTAEGCGSATSLGGMASARSPRWSPPPPCLALMNFWPSRGCHVDEGCRVAELEDRIRAMEEHFQYTIVRLCLVLFPLPFWLEADYFQLSGAGGAGVPGKIKRFGKWFCQVLICYAVNKTSLLLDRARNVMVVECSQSLFLT